MAIRVVLAMSSLPQRTLVRFGLDLDGGLEVVGVAPSPEDVGVIVRSLDPDVVLVDYPERADGALGVVAVVADAAPRARAVLFDAMLARHTGRLELLGRGAVSRPRPVEVARVLHALLQEAPLETAL